MSEPVLSECALNRALLARQGLLERHPAPLPDALERVGGIQAQYAPSMYVGLFARVAGFERARLDAALEAREVVQATLMRLTIHLVSRRDFWPLARAVRDARRSVWLRARKDVAEVEMADAAATVEAALRERGVLHRRELEELVGRPRAAGVGLWVDLVRAPPSGTWERRRADLFALASDWVGEPPRGAPVAPLVERYLRAFGPARAADVASFTGLSDAALRPALERVAGRRFRDAAGKVLLDVAEAPLPDPATPAPPRFLPHWDATLLVHARRTGLLPEPYRPRIFHVRAPHSYATFTLDGRVAGTWRHDDDRIELEPFEHLDAADRRALREEGERLAGLFAEVTRAGG